ncbi:DUF3800 domain-containing protein [Dietzia maris]|uniref:DUF3800 domain-containing protein n=1 Tax=Dietzia maris TaxID=37915 RepID=UPI00343944C5
MIFAYIDDTGDDGDPAKNGATKCFGLGCLLIEAESWPEAHEQTVQFRKSIRESFGVQVRSELKANYLIRSSGTIRHLDLAPSQRGLIYRYHLRHVERLGGLAFTVLIDKTKEWTSPRKCREDAWKLMIERLETHSRKSGQVIMVFHDIGENDLVRRIFRRSRKFLPVGNHYGGGYTMRQADLLIEDPVPRDSAHCYFIQMADLIAYAGFRTYMTPGKHIAQVCPSTMWNHLGKGIHKDVNRLVGGTPGLVVRPR